MESQAEGNVVKMIFFSFFFLFDQAIDVFRNQSLQDGALGLQNLKDRGEIVNRLLHTFLTAG